MNHVSSSIFAAALVAAAACGSHASPQVQSTASPPEQAPKVQEKPSGPSWSLKVETVTYGSRLAVNSVGIKLERDDSRQVWRGYAVRKRFAHRGGGGGSSAECSHDAAIPAEAIAELERRIQNVTISDHERRGGGGSTTLVLTRDGDRMRTQLKCDLTQAASATEQSLCALARTMVSLYKAHACTDPETSPACTSAFAMTDQPPRRKRRNIRATKLAREQEQLRQKSLRATQCKI